MNQPTGSTGLALFKPLKYFDKLAEASESLNSILKSHYLNKRAIYEAKIVNGSDVSTPQAPVKCSRCNLHFAETLAQHYIKPGISNTKYFKKIIRKQEKGKLLTKYQCLSLKKMDISKNNKMVIVCGFCNHNHSVLLAKPVDLKPESKTQEHTEIKQLPTENNHTKKRKKKRKDKYCGLNSSIVSTISKKIPVHRDFVPLVTQHTTINTNKHENKHKDEKNSSNKNKKPQINNNKNTMNMNNQQITRNLSISKIKNAKSKKTLKSKISNMLNINNESNNSSSALQNLLKSV